MDAARLCGGNALRLPPADALALALRHKRQNLQHQIRNKRPQQILVARRIQKRHVNHTDIHALLLGQNAPLRLNLLIIPAQPVNAWNIEQIALLKPPHQPPVVWPVKVLSGLLVHVDGLLCQPPFAQRRDLPVLVLIRAGNTDIAVICTQSFTLQLKNKKARLLKSRASRRNVRRMSVFSDAFRADKVIISAAVGPVNRADVIDAP